MADRIELQASLEGGDDVERDLDAIVRRIDKLEGAVEKLGGEPLDLKTEPAEKDVRELIREFERLSRAFDKAERELDLRRTRNETERTQESARRLRSAFDRVTDAGTRLNQFAGRLPAEFRPARAELDRVQRKTDEARRGFQQLANLKGGFDGLLRSIGSLRAGLAGLVAALGVAQIARFGRVLLQLGKDALETKTRFDRLIPGLRAFTGSTQLAEEVADELAATADRLKTPLANLIDPFLGISSGGKEAGLSIGEINELFEQSLVSARAFGKGAGEVQRLLTGISQVAGKGTASMEEFRQQIGEAIPNAIPAVARGLGVTVPEAIEKISSGSLDSATALRALTAGFRELNSEAAAGQLDTVAGSLGAFARLLEQAQDALADGFAPGLREAVEALIEFGDGQEDLLRQLGEVAGAIFENIGRYTELLTVIREIAKASPQLGQNFRDLADGIGDAVERSTGIFGLRDAIGGLGDAFTGLSAEAREAFEQLERDAEKAVFGVEKSAEQILADFKRTFREQAEAAGIAADDIVQTERRLADEIGDITEQNQKEREALQLAREKARRENAENLIEIERVIRDRLIELLKEEEAARAQAQGRLLEETAAAGQRRIAEERKTAAAIAATLDRLVDAEREAGAARLEAAQETSTKLEDLERKAAEKIAEIREAAQEKAAELEGEARVEALQQAAEKILDIEVKLAADRAREIERVAKAEEEAAQRRIEAQQKIQDALEKSLDVIRKTREELEKIAEGGEGEDAGGAFEKIREEVDETRKSLEDLQRQFEELLAPDLLGEDAADILGAAFDKINGFLGTTGDELDFFSRKSEEVGEDVQQLARDLDQELLDALRQVAEGGGAAFGQLSEGAQAAVLDLVQSFTEIAQSGTTTEEDLARLAERLDTIFGDLGQSLDEPAQQLQERAKEIADSQTEAADAAEEGGERTKVAWDEATQTLESVAEAGGEAAEGTTEAGDAAEAGGEKAEEASTKWEAIVAAMAEAAEEGRDAGEAGREAAEGFDAAADAAEPLKEGIIPEEEPEKLRQVGAAAAEAAGPVQSLVDPTTALADASERIDLALDGLREDLPEVLANVTEILSTLGESDVDLPELAAQLERLPEPLTIIAAQVGTLAESVVSLPADVGELLSSAEPLFGLFAEVAADDRVGQIATALGNLSTAAGNAAEPIQAIQAALTDLADRSAEIHGFIDGATQRIRDLGAPETTDGVGRLLDLLKSMRETLETVDTVSTAIKRTLQDLNKFLPDLNATLEATASTLISKVAPGLEAVENKAVEVRNEFDRLKAKAGEVAVAFRDMQQVASQAVKRLLDDVRELNAELRNTVRLLNEARDAARSVEGLP